MNAPGKKALTSAELICRYRGPAILSYGFRPFFLFAAVWAAVAMAIWPALLAGSITLPTTLDPVRWHAHELIYGYVPAVISGFLLTAVPNWTGRLPVVGARLLALFSLWAAGRLAILCSAVIGEITAAAIDLLFLAALGCVVAREIIAGRNWRNLMVLVVIPVLFTGNLVFHAEAMLAQGGGYGTRLGVAAIILLIMLIGGRIVPSFTRNWLVRQGAGRLPHPFGRFDRVAMVVAGAALVSWVAAPAAALTAWLAAATAPIQLWWLWRWAGERTGAEPLVAILHIAYAFVPLGFGLLALATLRPDLLLPSGAVHAWTAGAIGTMTLAVMTRASLGHTGRPLEAGSAVRTIYVAVIVAALARIAAGFGMAPEPMLQFSAAAWIFAFAGFAAVFAPLLAHPRT
jgi:uncharacterized protein involved in response to NO